MKLTVFTVNNRERFVVISTRTSFLKTFATIKVSSLNFLLFILKPILEKLLGILSTRFQILDDKFKWNCGQTWKCFIDYLDYIIQYQQDVWRCAKLDFRKSNENFRLFQNSVYNGENIIECLKKSKWDTGWGLVQQLAIRAWWNLNREDNMIVTKYLEHLT